MLREITKEKLDKILENHKHYLNKDCVGWENMRADLSNADLRNANLSFTNLSYADFNNTDLSYANFDNTNLSYANFNNADLNYANLNHVNLWKTDLNNADINCANLSHVNFSYAKNIPYIPMVCPEEGLFIGWKKASGFIVKLEIPEDAKRSSANTRKCRCSKAKVLGIYNFNHTLTDSTEVKTSKSGSDLTYKVGEMVYPDSFDENRWDECSHGIHFFMNFKEAVDY